MISPIRRSEAAAPQDLPPLPREARTRDGQVVDPAADTWMIRMRAGGGNRLRLNWNALEAFSPEAVHLAKLIVASRMPNQAPASASNDLKSMITFSRWYSVTGHAFTGQSRFGWDVLSLNLAEAFLEFGLTTREAGNPFARLRDLYRYGAEALRHPHFKTEVLLQLESVRAPGNAKGQAVRAGDPDAGELSPDEIEAILDAIRQEKGREEDRLLVWLCLELGRNSMQYSLLRNEDLHRAEVASGDARLYQLSVVRMKKRTVVDEKRRWPISPELGDRLWNLKQGGPDDRLLWWLSANYPEGDMNSRLKRFAAEAEIRSRRASGGVLHLTPRRFRTTLLTNAADEEASPEHLAALADHTDTQNVMVYIDNSPGYILRLGEKVDAIYDPMVKRFKGRIADSAEADGLPIPGFAAQLPLLDLGGIGNCGAKGICGLAPPLTCYACDHFVAFRDGPHQQVVRAMEESMEKMGDRVALQIAPALAAAREVVREIAAESGAGGAA